MLKTRAQVRQELSRTGQSVASWAIARGYNPNMVTAILKDDATNPRYTCVRGKAHEIAVSLGIKEGEISHSANAKSFTAAAAA